jgi:hypothetical protein
MVAISLVLNLTQLSEWYGRWCTNILRKVAHVWNIIILTPRIILIPSETTIRSWIKFGNSVYPNNSVTFSLEKSGGIYCQPVLWKRMQGWPLLRVFHPLVIWATKAWYKTVYTQVSHYYMPYFTGWFVTINIKSKKKFWICTVGAFLKKLQQV